MLRVFSWLVVVSLLGGCYSQFKATKQVGKALAHYPQIVAKIALDSFPCDVIRIDTIISESDSIVEYQAPIENFTTMMQVDTITRKVYIKARTRTVYITKVVESTAKLSIVNARIDSAAVVIRELQTNRDALAGKLAKKAKVIWWLIAFMIGVSLPYLIRIVRYITLL
jgi:hypothetical protein